MVRSHTMSDQSGLVGVSVSTTGDPHRLRFLETCIPAWAEVLSASEPLFVTVDGDQQAADRAHRVIMDVGLADRADVLRVGQGGPERGGRQGVAMNKNTGIELLMDAGAQHLFLCDDDTHPLKRAALEEHIEMGPPHSMVCWGRHRRPSVHTDQETGLPYASWSWPRGVLVYTQRQVIEEVGGMVEAFGPGGHEHVEWSRRIHQAGLTPASYLSPVPYARSGMGAAVYWHCEDMPKMGEPLGNLRLRRKQITSVRREEGDWRNIEALMKSRDGDTRFVPYRAHENGRESATLCMNHTSLGAEK